VTKPPPKPDNPLRHFSRLIAIPARKPSPSPTAMPNREIADSFADSEAPTAKKGAEFRAALLIKYWAQCSPEDQDYLIRTAERYAERNRK